ncbi:MAG TPA: glycosyltransferase family 4 protein [Methylotenera sp.]|nr:glycosyltransferase family 4 protein [Methylotenera sp.]HPV45085.1 glycosyltransferase family 4 protein [Methylotenera sp.]
MNNILFISKGEAASSTRYRALQYFPHFIQTGWQPSHITISGGFLSILRTFLAAKKSDVVVILRKTFPYPIFWILRKLSKKLIFDFDDAIFSNTDGSYSKTRMHRFKITVASCDYIFAGNQYLAAKAKNYNPSVAVIPTSVEVDKYNLSCQKDNEAFELVWIGSKSTRKYIAEIIPSLENAAQNIPNLRLKIIADFELTSTKLNINNVAWTEHSEAIELCKADVGLAPMPENNWTKGKCALKVLQYMASGLPVISSQSGVNAYVVEDGISGYLVSDSSQWAERIVQLSKDKVALTKMGERGRCRVQTEFSIKAVFQKIITTLS